MYEARFFSKLHNRARFPRKLAPPTDWTAHIIYDFDAATTTSLLVAQRHEPLINGLAELASSIDCRSGSAASRNLIRPVADADDVAGQLAVAGLFCRMDNKERIDHNQARRPCGPKRGAAGGIGSSALFHKTLPADQSNALRALPVEPPKVAINFNGGRRRKRRCQVNAPRSAQA